MWEIIFTVALLVFIAGVVGYLAFHLLAGAVAAFLDAVARARRN